MLHPSLPLTVSTVYILYCCVFTLLTMHALDTSVQKEVYKEAVVLFKEEKQAQL